MSSDFKQGQRVSFRLSGKTEKGTVQVANTLTVWVKLDKEDHVILRHIKKDRVKLV